VYARFSCVRVLLSVADLMWVNDDDQMARYRKELDKALQPVMSRLTKEIEQEILRMIYRNA
jgi:hypothetical protein